MHELDGHGALAHRAGDALRPTVAHVAGDEDARACSTRAGTARGRGSSPAAPSCRFGPVRTKPPVSRSDGAVEPAGARLLTDEDEERRQAELLVAVRPRKVAPARCVSPLTSVTSVLGWISMFSSSRQSGRSRYCAHPAFRSSPRMTRWHRRGVAREVDRRLAGRVARRRPRRPPRRGTAPPRSSPRRSRRRRRRARSRPGTSSCR